MTIYNGKEKLFIFVLVEVTKLRCKTFYYLKLMFRPTIFSIKNLYVSATLSESKTYHDNKFKKISILLPMLQELLFIVKLKSIKGIEF